MTTLHRKPRIAAGHANEQLPSYYTTIDILPSAVSSSSGSSNSSANAIGSSKLYTSVKDFDDVTVSSSSKARRQHGHNKYARRSGLFGAFSRKPLPSSTPKKKKKMSTTQLRAFFVACVLVYLGALCFADDIVRFGKAVNSDATRQKIFSQWRPMHSAASEYLRAMVADPLSVRPTDDDNDAATPSVAVDVNEDEATATAAPLTPAVLAATVAPEPSRAADVSTVTPEQVQSLVIASAAPVRMEEPIEATTSAHERLSATPSEATKTLEPVLSSEPIDQVAVAVRDGDEEDTLEITELLDEAHTPAAVAVAVDADHESLIETQSDAIASASEPVLLLDEGEQDAQVAVTSEPVASQAPESEQPSVATATAATNDTVESVAAAVDAPTEAAGRSVEPPLATRPV